MARSGKTKRQRSSTSAARTQTGTAWRSPLWSLLLVVLVYLAEQYGLFERLRGATAGGDSPARPPVEASDPAHAGDALRVTQVVDGDTLVLQDGQRVRLIGVDTPETKHPTRPVEPFGPEASRFTKQAVEGRDVVLRFDRHRYDRYQRVLAYVYLGDWCLNEELIRAGLSECITKYPFDSEMKRRFQRAEAEARQSRRGIWGGGRMTLAGPARDPDAL